MDYQLILEELLNKMDLKEQVSILKKIDTPLLLHYFIENYNWDNGLDYPISLSIIRNVFLEQGFTYSTMQMGRDCYKILMRL
jgi:hypothetical protein